MAASLQHASLSLARTLMLGVVLAIGSAPAVRAATEAGEVTYLRGDGLAELDGDTRELRNGDRVYAGDSLKTGRTGVLQVRLDDGTRFAMGNNSAFRIDEFKYGGEAEEESVTTRILTGTFRFVSGLIAKRRAAAMKVETPVATIGIRGTHVAGEVEGESARVVLMEPEDPEAPNAITVSNPHGSVEIEQPGYGTEIPNASSPPSPPRRMRLRSIENLMRSLQATRRSVRPRPSPH